MRVGIVHTFTSPCRCHETLERALVQLGHTTLRVDSEEVPVRADELAALDLVFDQTDRFRGEGVLRPTVRAILDTRCARCIGSDARGCFLADDKLATRRALERAGVPVPPGAPVADRNGLDLSFPRVVKPVHEHMSRGLALVHDQAEQDDAVRRARAAGSNALLLESFVEGREVAVTVLGGRVLPIVEWPVEAGSVLDFDAKRTGADPEIARLDEEPRSRIEKLALMAFRALGLQDWARFDLRLDTRGSLFFLEANTKPSLEAGSPCLVAARAVELDEAAFVNEIIEIARRRLGPR